METILFAHLTALPHLHAHEVIALVAVVAMATAIYLFIERKG